MSYNLDQTAAELGLTPSQVQSLIECRLLLLDRDGLVADGELNSFILRSATSGRPFASLPDDLDDPLSYDDLRLLDY